RQSNRSSSGELDLNPVRPRFEDPDRWRHGELARRRYDSYDAYLAHQSSKLDRIRERRGEKDARVALPEFVRRFRACSALAGARAVVCLGARLGAEVRALLALGFFAVGVDVNPGPANEYVLHGDFHRLVFPTARWMPSTRMRSTTYGIWRGSCARCGGCCVPAACSSRTSCWD